ncbi:oligosaccharide flippase family protein [Candidatus Woesebacteria bacterium]|nr:oligosaccharide flippase family protein [Candidatus Woesebacteria bacterium]
MTETIAVAQLKRRTLIGAISYFVRSSFLQIIGFVSAVIISVFFTPEEFGIYGLVQQIIGILIFVSDIGFAAALVQKKDEPSQDDYTTAFWVQQALGWFIVAVALVLVFFGVVSAKTGPVGNWILLALAISFPIISLKTIPSIKLERRLAFAKLVQPQIIENLVFHSVLIYCAWNKMGAMAYSYAVLARSLSGTAVMLYIEPWKASVSFSRESFKKLFKFGAQFQLNDFLARIKDQLFFLALGAYLPLKEFGYIQWAKNWSMYPYNLTVNTVMTITFPAFSRLQGDRALLQKAIEKSLYFITLFLFPLLIGMSLFITPVLQLTDQYAKWQPALFSFVLFTLSITWSGISSPITNALNAVGHISSTLKLMVMWTLLTWIVTPLCIYFFGYNGVALSALLISCSSYAAVVMLKKVLPTINVRNSVWRQTVAAGVMAGFGYVLSQNFTHSYVQLAVSILATGLIYCIVLYVVGRQQLIAELRSLIKK